MERSVQRRPALHEVRTVLARAEANRRRLVDLVVVLPGDYWERRAEGDVWEVERHVAHVAAMDEMVCETVADATEHGVAWLGGAATREELDRRRDAAATGIMGVSHGDLVEALMEARREAIQRLSRLTFADLGASIQIPAGSPWEGPVALPVRQYLQAWAAHDLDHESAIRRAIEVTPDAATLASSVVARMASRRKRSG